LDDKLEKVMKFGCAYLMEAPGDCIYMKEEHLGSLVDAEEEDCVGIKILCFLGAVPAYTLQDFRWSVLFLCVPKRNK